MVCVKSYCLYSKMGRRPGLTDIGLMHINNNDLLLINTVSYQIIKTLVVAYLH